jgi:hypothetical protein
VTKKGKAGGKIQPALSCIRKGERIMEDFISVSEIEMACTRGGYVDEKSKFEYVVPYGIVEPPYGIEPPYVVMPPYGVDPPY